MNYEKLAKRAVAYIKNLEDGVISIEESKMIGKRTDEIEKSGEKLCLPSLDWII